MAALFARLLFGLPNRAARNSSAILCLLIALPDDAYLESRHRRELAPPVLN
jgi:hypothetical protein